MYLIYFKPYETRKNNFIELFNEGCIAIIAFHLFLCTGFIESDTIKY